jgi:hypothetical protein
MWYRFSQLVCKIKKGVGSAVVHQLLFFLIQNVFFVLFFVFFF